MAPKKYPLYFKATGRYYRLSGDGREYVFEDGQRVAVPPPQAHRAHAETATDQPQQSESSSRAQQRALNDAARALTLQDEGNGTQNWSGQDPRTGIATQWEIGPTQQAPATPKRPLRLYNAKLIRSHGSASLPETAGDAPAPGPSRRGFTDYERSNNPARDFAQFRVVEVLVIPPPPSAMSVITGGPPPSGPNDLYITRMRRFVIIGQGNRQDFRTFKALPIKTYSGEGVGAPNVVKSHHTIIHTTKDPPKPMDSELPQQQSNGVVESGMRSRSIRVRTYDKTTMLDPISRLDFFDLHEFDYNHYIKAFGTVHEDSRPHLLPLYDAVRAALELTTKHSAAVSPHVVTSPGITAPPTPSPAIMEKIKEIKDYATAHDINPPPVTTNHLTRFAQDPDSFKKWMASVKAQIDKILAQRDAGDQDDDNDDDDDDDDDDDSDNEGDSGSNEDPNEK